MDQIGNFTGRFELRSVSKSSHSYVVTVHCEIIRGLLGVSELSAMHTVFLHNPFAPMISQDMLASWLSNQVVIISVHMGIIWRIDIYFSYQGLCSNHAIVPNRDATLKAWGRFVGIKLQQSKAKHGPLEHFSVYSVYQMYCHYVISPPADIKLMTFPRGTVCYSCAV